MRRDQRGESLYGVLVAAFVVAIMGSLMVRSVSGYVMAASRSDNSDTAISLATKTIQQESALGCATATGTESSSQAASLSSVCGGIGSFDTEEKQGQVTYQETVSTRWTAKGVSSCSGYAGATPSGLELDVTVAWPNPGHTSMSSRTVDTAESVPPNGELWHQNGLGAIVVSGVSPGQTVTLDGVNGDEVTHNPDPYGCVWFPYLTTGAWTLTLPSGSSTVTVGSGATTAVTTA